MPGFGPTAKLLDYNKTPLTPWLTQDLIEQELATVEYAERVADILLDSIDAADHMIMETLCLDQLPKYL